MENIPGITIADYPQDTTIQQLWDQPICKVIFNSLVEASTNVKDRARFNAITQEHSSDWLNALPNANLGLKLNNNQFRTACALRLGARICHSHTCICGAEVGSDGVHGLSCKKSAGRHPRHNACNDLIKRSLCSADFSATREPLGVSRSDGKRPDGMTMYPWKNGKCLLWDYTCSDTHAPSHLIASAKEAGKAAKEGEDRKIKKYEHLLTDYHFIPISVETFGTWGEIGLKFVKEVGSLIADKTHEKRSTSFLFPVLSIALQRDNYLAITVI